LGLFSSVLEDSRDIRAQYWPITKSELMLK